MFIVIQKPNSNKVSYLMLSLFHFRRITYVHFVYVNISEVPNGMDLLYISNNLSILYISEWHGFLVNINQCKIYCTCSEWHGFIVNIKQCKTYCACSECHGFIVNI